MKNKKIMPLAMALDYIRKIGRCELYDELKFINDREYFCPTTLIGRDSCYLKAIRVSLVSLGYDEDWVNGPFRTLLYRYYYNEKEPLYPYQEEEFYKYYETEELKQLFLCIDSLTSIQETGYFKDLIALFENQLINLNVTEINPTKAKRVVQYSLDGEVIKVYKSIKEANEAMGKPGNSTNIGSCCSGLKNTAYGFIWKYYDDAPKN